MNYARLNTLVQRIALPAVVVVAVAVRLVVFLNYSPSYYPDSREYLQFARQIQTLDFRDYTGMRTPAYPGLLALVAPDGQLVWIAQALMGVTTIALLCIAMHRYTRSATATLALGTWLSLSLNLIFFESAILTEALSTLLLALVCVQTSQMLRALQPNAKALVLLSAIVTLAWLTRPLLLYLVPLVGIAAARPFLHRPMGIRHTALLGWYWLPALGAVLGWSTVNQLALGYFGASTTLGLNLVNHSGAFIADAPPEYEIVKTIFLRQMATHAAGPNQHVMVIWEAYPEMMERTGLSLGALSQKLSRMSVELFVSHPQAYSASVWRAWTTFWDSTIYWYPNELRSPALRDVLTELLDSQERARAWLHVGFAIAVLSLLARPVRRRLVDPSAIALAGVLVLAGSLTQAVLELGENARYAVPFQPLIAWAVVAWAAKLLRPDQATHP